MCGAIGSQASQRDVREIQGLPTKVYRAFIPPHCPLSPADNRREVLIAKWT